MKTIFARMLLAFVITFILFMVILALIFSIGFNRSVSGWNRQQAQEAVGRFSSQLQQLVKTADDLRLLSSLEFLQEYVPANIPVFIFDNNKQLLFACRNGYPGAQGHNADWAEFYLSRHSTQLEYNPIDLTGQRIGYFLLGKSGFSSNPANRRLLDSITTTVWTGILIAFLLALLVALFFSRNLSATARIVAEGINKIADGKFEVHVPEKGAEEIIRIARNANRLGLELKREAELRNQWAQDITHDLNTPLTALKTQLEGMKDGVLEFSTQRIALNLKELQRIETLVADLGMLTRLESPEMQVTLAVIDAEGFLTALQNRFFVKIRESGVLFHTERKLATFTGDENLLLRAVSNLLDNAIRHTPRQQPVGLSLAAVDGWVELVVYNRGDVIPPRELKRVFDRLFRGDYARNSPGSGLGLTITNKIVQLHQGEITINSSQAEGTRVIIRLPDSVSR